MKTLPDPSFVYEPKSVLKKSNHKHKKLSDPLGQKPKWPRWKKVMLILLLSGIAVAVGFGLYLFFHVAKITSNPFSFNQKLKGEDEGRVNILLLGVGDPGHDGENLADTNIIASIDTRNNQVALISIPRDTRVDIPGRGEDKINAAHTYGGIPLSVETVEENFGITIPYYIRANFTGLKQVVDAVGGVEIDNKTLLVDSEYPCDKNQYRSCGFKLQPGPQKLDGATALKYARCRKGTCGDDFGRAERQQEVLAKVGEKAARPDSVINPSKFNSLLSSVSDNVKTNLSLAEMKRLYDIGKQVDQSKTINIVLSIKDGGLLEPSNNSSDLLPVGGSFSGIKSLVKNVFTMGPIFAEAPRIAIENGTTTVGLGGKLKDKIEDEGYPIAIYSVSNAIKRDYTATQIIDYSNGQKPNTINYLQNLLGTVATSPTQPNNPGSYDVKVILGSDYAAKTSTSNSGGNSSSSSNSSSR